MIAVLKNMSDKAHAAYRGIVKALAAGDEPSEGTIREALALTGKGPADLEADIERGKRRLEAERLQAEFVASEAAVNALAEKSRAASAAFHQFQREASLKLGELQTAAIRADADARCASSARNDLSTASTRILAECDREEKGK